MGFSCLIYSGATGVVQGLLCWLFMGSSKLVEVLRNGIEAVMVLTVTILKQRVLL